MMAATTKIASKELAEHCRGQLADLRALSRELTDDEWDAPSLCAGWTVKTVFAHLLGGRRISLPAMGYGIARYRSMDVWADTVSRQLSDRTPVPELIEAFDKETSRWPEKGIAGLEPKVAKLADNLVHELDVRRAIGRPRPIPADRLTAALWASTRTNMWGTKKRIAGLRLEATDLGWSYGDGPVVSGPGEDLLLAINGRSAGLERLGGPGRSILADRLS